MVKLTPRRSELQAEIRRLLKNEWTRESINTFLQSYFQTIPKDWASNMFRAGLGADPAKNRNFPSAMLKQFQELLFNASTVRKESDGSFSAESWKVIMSKKTWEMAKHSYTQDNAADDTPRTPANSRIQSCDDEQEPPWSPKRQPGGVAARVLKRHALFADIQLLFDKICAAYHSPNTKEREDLAHKAQEKVGQVLRQDVDAQKELFTLIQNSFKDIPVGPCVRQRPREETAEGLCAAAECAQSGFLAFLLELKERAGIPDRQVHPAEPKTLASTLRKLSKASSTVHNTFDFNRTTFTFKTLRDFMSFQAAIQAYNARIVKMKIKGMDVEDNTKITEPPCMLMQIALPLDKFDEAMKDLVADDCKEWIVEIQLTTPEILETKKLCHPIYEILRLILFPEKDKFPKFCFICGKNNKLKFAASKA